MHKNELFISRTNALTILRDDWVIISTVLDAGLVTIMQKKAVIQVNN